MAADLIQIFKAAEGKTVAEVEEEIQGSYFGTHALTPALTKLLFDRSEEEEDDGRIEKLRWEQLNAAEALRQKQSFPTLQAYQKALAEQLGGDSAELREVLYADLPEFRRIRGFRPLAQDSLLHRLNCAQIQGLIIYALDLKVEIMSTDLAERRRFFRCLKFQRLLAEVAETKAGFSVTLSGPLRLFQQAQSYGLRLANFFPYVLQMKRWEVNAELKMGTKNLSLHLNEKIGVKSHYREFLPFIPPELTAFIASFNERGQGWTAEVGDDYLHLGDQSYCFPDVSLKGPLGEKVHLELFHKWHSSQLAHRLKTLEANPDQPLVIGVAEEVRSDKACETAISQSKWFNRNGFAFKTFPTPKALLAVLGHRGSPTDFVDRPVTSDLSTLWDENEASGKIKKAREAPASSPPASVLKLFDDEGLGEPSGG